MQFSNQIVLVTGANQGLGYSVIKVAGQRWPQNTYLLCSRNLEAGKQAIEKLQRSGVSAKIDLIQLDVTDDDQIAAAAKYVESTYGKLDVLVNNAGILRIPPTDISDLKGTRQTYNELLNIHIASVAVVTNAFIPLLYESSDPKVINVSSGLGSMQNALTQKMGRHPPYGASKIGMNGLTVHLQVAQNDRIKAEQNGDIPTSEYPRIRYYTCAPGPLKTAFNGFRGPKLPDAGAEVIIHLMGDDETKYEGGTYWEYEDGQMSQVPW
ncbi:short chain dehydrogenase/reductase family protein [Talaromyces proteolyticus]|uniref:Short chain dehydrogenase/reductase family protein n=1 Tax=Talaromyces proteolyticus TaxID=1131652 RepID=A0AAD4KI91_9EURO|nr:short chain dehydrogenase/reductase family protein [Talaromyces proteolyticus]KAH8693052.1 short chain dehydrogenase/reductase family protein [Talaromyces proteolyticus]